MPRLPTSTVTFLFSDIEASTHIVQHLGDAASEQVFADHRRLLRDVVESAGGLVYQDQGESFLFVFQRAKDAVLAAVTAQRALTIHPWPKGVMLRVRMGLHSGEPAVSCDEYVGLDVHRVARICQAGHGGLILLSQATQELVGEGLPGGVSLQDLGKHRLKDLASPEHIFQAIAPDLPTEFPPLKSLSALPHNLPIQLTSFIGREREMAEVKRLLSTTRLLTLTGAGGCGKTRLALQVAAEVLEDFADGVWFVELAALSDPAFVSQAVASALGVREQPGRLLLVTLSDYLQSKHLLVAVDNCEQLVAACAQLTEILLRSCPNLRILVTSREPLGIAGELTYRVPSLSVPDLRCLPDLRGVVRHEAVRLFVERAQFVVPTFQVTDRNAVALAQVCTRLDGIPLAVELAAARVKVLPVEQIAGRLDDRFRLLAEGSRTALPRHQTLRATMDWSYDLLSEKERVLLRRLSVFVGGFTLETVEAICTGGDVDKSEVLNLLAHLVDKSLVVMGEQDGEARYRLLETVRQYGWERLLEAGEAEVTCGRHQDWYLGLAEKAEPELEGAQQLAWLERLDVEYDNLRAALEWSKRGERGPEPGLRLAGALWFFWFVRGYLSEGRTWLEGALARSVGSSTSPRAKALFYGGVLALLQDDYRLAAALSEEGLLLCQELGHKRGIALAQVPLGLVAFRQANYGRATALFEQSLALFRELGDRWGIALSFWGLGIMALYQGDFGRAKRMFDDSLTVFRQLGNRWGIAFSASRLAIVARREDDYERAAALFEESLSLQRDLRDKWGMAFSLHNLGLVVHYQGDHERAIRLCMEGLILMREVGDKWWISQCLTGLGGVILAQRRQELAARLLGAAEALRDALGVPIPPDLRHEIDRNVTTIRDALGDEAFAAAWTEGRTMTLEQAIEYALKGNA
ncbi:MAG: ATP-binding protein [Armatimonadota bacterium]